MANLHGFNANDVEPTTDFDPVPAGRYVAVITQSEVKLNKAGTGSYLQFTFQIIDGEYKGRYLWARLNLDALHPVLEKLATTLGAAFQAEDLFNPNPMPQSAADTPRYAGDSSVPPGTIPPPTRAPRPTLTGTGETY